MGLATLLERVRLLFKIFECDFQSLIFLWCFKTVKLDFHIKYDENSASTINGEVVRGVSSMD